MRSTARVCGTCNLCCKLLSVAEFNKRIDTWCPHARPGCGGCSIYADRPSSCREFRCGWLSGLPEFGDEGFPARCKMVLSLRVPPHSIREQGIMVTVDPAYPNAWRREPYYSRLKVRVEIRVGRRRIMLDADGSETPVPSLSDR